MRKVYKLELEVTLEEAEERKAIQAARDHFIARGGARAPVDSKAETWRDIPAEEACSDVVDAIMELTGDNGELEEAGIEVISLSCVEPKSKDVRPECDENEAEAPEKEELEVGCDNAPGLDDVETGMYLCRWPNGEFSLVKAENRRDALIQLDEWAGAHPSFLFALDICMADFRLTDLGKIELNEFGEETERLIWEQCYPELDSVLSRPQLAPCSDQKHDRRTKNEIRRAVRRERSRLWKNQPEPLPAQTEAGRQLQKQMRTGGPVADYYIEQRAKQILESEAGEGGKPN